ncbi:hypothetical protein MKW92_020577 [Papaver armeniacum]|nr:hypothetical protein MKW92_020577 [Papaver armeniacum]
MKLNGNPFPEMNLNISLPKLKYFEFDSWDSASSGEVKLHAPSLSSFIFRSYMLSTYLTLMNLPSLATADINILVISQVPEMCAQRAMGLLRGIRNVEVLTLNHYFLEALGGAPDIQHTQPTEHFNIQHLKLQTYLSRDCLRSIFFVLNNSPNIESISLQISQVVFDPDNIGGYWDAVLSLPCRMCHLKIAEIKGLRGHAIELKILERLLKHATVLEKVVLTSYSTEQDSEREKRMTKFSETLLTFPTASKKILILLKF